MWILPVQNEKAITGKIESIAKYQNFRLLLFKTYMYVYILYFSMGMKINKFQYRVKWCLVGIRQDLLNDDKRFSFSIT